MIFVFMMNFDALVFRGVGGGGWLGPVLVYIQQYSSFSSSSTLSFSSWRGQEDSLNGYALSSAV
jgi:hypothetical protein